MKKFPEKPHDTWDKLQLRSFILPAAALVVITVFTYVPAISNGFIWDDYDGLLHSPLINSRDALYKLWFTTESTDYFPLVYTIFFFEYHRWGMNPRPYHIANVIIHALASVFLWMVLRRLKIPGAWICALMFAVHPVNVESVAWIFQQRTTLPMVFALLSMLAYLRFHESSKALWYIISFVAFLLGLLSKTSVVMLPFIILGCIWWDSGKIRLKDLLQVIPFFVFSVIFGIATAWFQSHKAISTEVIRDDSFWERLAGAGWAVWFYLSKAIFPYKLTFVYPKWEINPGSVVSYLPLTALVICFAFFWIYRKSLGRPLLMGLGYYVFGLFPVLGFLDIYFMKFSLVADHWQYFAIPGIISLVVGTAAYSFERFGLKGKRIGAILAALTVFLLGFLSWRQERIYKDEETLWRDTIAKNPHAWLAHYNLGLNLAQQGLSDEAFIHFRQTIKINPNYAEAYNNIGLIYQMRGDLKRAMLSFQKALKIEPNMAEAHNNLANVFADLGRNDEAIREYKKAIQINPSFASAYNNLGVILANQGKYDEAVLLYQQAIKLMPDYSDAHYNLAIAYFKKKMYADAWREIHRCKECGMQLNPAFIKELSERMPDPKAY